MADKIPGQCLCGGVSFDVTAGESLDVCHCRMCQRWTGSVFIDLSVEDKDIHFSSDETLTWYDSSDWAKRGFCKRCGSSLFYRLKQEGAKWAVLAGALDLPPGMRIREEIFIDEKPDYYDLAGDRERVTGAEILARFQGTTL